MPPEDLVSHDECMRSMERIHTRVDKIENTATAVETSAKNIEKCVSDMKSLMYGSEKADGIITRVSNLGQKVGGLFWFGGVIIIGLVGTLISIAIAAIFKKPAP